MTLKLPSVRLLIPLIILTLLLASGIAVTTYLPTSTPQHILETNVTPFHSTITWYTSIPTLGCVYVLDFPPRFACHDSGALKRTNHHITLTNFKPTQAYRLLIQSGFNFTRLTTKDKRFIPDQLPALPNPAYGQLLLPQTNQPVQGATIIASTPAGHISTLTNLDGRWNLDLRGNYPKGTKIPLIIIWSSQVIFTQQLIIGAHQPTPPLYLQEPFIPKTIRTISQ